MTTIDQKNGAFLGPLRPLYPCRSPANERYRRVATLWDRGVETTLTVRTVVRVPTGETAGWGFTPGIRAYDEEILLPLNDRLCFLNGTYLGGGSHRGIFPNKAPRLRTITIARSGYLELVQGKAIYQTVIPRTQLLKLEPEAVATHHPIRPTELYQRRKQYLHGKFLPRSNAWQYVYERWYLFDPDRVPDVRRKGIYMGHARFGIPPYTAEALIKISAKAPRFIANCDGYMHGFLRKRDDTPIERLLRGVRASMALRDTILVNTAVSRRLQVRDIIDLSSGHKVGEWVHN